jgi:hypothetical protein
MINNRNIVWTEINPAGETTTSPGSLLTGNGQPGSQQVILVGVSTEVTVGIALASFVIGVALTAILWCIHMRTGTLQTTTKNKLFQLLLL